MRKGILSLTPLGRRKATAKLKTANMEKAEKSAATRVEEAPEQEATADGKMFVQTIMVPKPRKDERKGVEAKDKVLKNARKKAKRNYIDT